MSERSEKTSKITFLFPSIEIVDNFRFPVSDTLPWSLNTNCMLKKAQQRLYFLRHLKSFGISTKALMDFYHGTIESVSDRLYHRAVWQSDCSGLQTATKGLQRQQLKSLAQNYHNFITSTPLAVKGKPKTLLRTSASLVMFCSQSFHLKNLPRASNHTQPVLITVSSHRQSGCWTADTTICTKCFCVIMYCILCI